MPFPVAAAVAGGTALVDGVIKLIQGSKQKKAEAWNNLMMTPAVEEAHRKGIESTMNMAKEKWEKREEYQMQLDEIPKIQSYLEANSGVVKRINAGEKVRGYKWPLWKNIAAGFACGAVLGSVGYYVIDRTDLLKK